MLERKPLRQVPLHQSPFVIIERPSNIIKSPLRNLNSQEAIAIRTFIAIKKLTNVMTETG